MRKIVAAMNITIDGFCDHTAGVPDAEMHDHYTELLKNGGDLLYGRTTYQLMEDYWPTLVKNPGNDKASNDFALAIQHIHKIVFSRTLKHVDWENSTLKKGNLPEEVLALKKQTGNKNIIIGSPSLIDALAKLNLIDEYQLCIHPVILGSGLLLFKSITDRVVLKLTKTKIFKSSGAVLHYYEPTKAGQ